MSERVQYSTKMDSDLKAKLIALSVSSRIPQSKLVDEAVEDLLKKYERDNK